MAPTRVPTRPTSSRGSQCRPKIESTPSTPPAAITSSAPPGMTSSAGWKINRGAQADTAVAGADVADQTRSGVHHLRVQANRRQQRRD
jgi:hypothetical protein